MHTVFTRSPREAAEFIVRGGLVAFPTETVYGLGADVFNEAAIKKVFEAKQRPADNPLIAHISKIEQLDLLASRIPNVAQKLISVYFPGPLTLVLSKSEGVPFAATAGLDTIGVRMPDHSEAREFLMHANTPVIAPSANLSGRPSPTTWQAVAEDLNERVDCILQGDDTEIGLESTVVDCTSDVPVILRAGAVSLEALREVVPEIRRLSTPAQDVARSPGMRHKHYAPKARVIVVNNGFSVPKKGEKSFIGLRSPGGDFRLVKLCSSAAEYAHSLFAFFRESDRAGVSEIYCEAIPDAGIGTAVMDRLRRAAER